MPVRPPLAVTVANEQGLRQGFSETTEPAPVVLIDSKYGAWHGVQKLSKIMLLPSSIRCPDSPLSPTYCLDMASLAAPGMRPEPYCAKEETEGDRSLDSPAAGGLDNTSLVGLGVVRVPAPAATTWSEHPREQAPDHAEMETPRRDNHDGSAGTSCTRIASTRMPCAEDDTAWQRALVPHPAGPRATRAASARAANPSSGFGTADCSCRALPPAAITPQVLHVPPNRPHTLFCPAAAPEREPSVLHRAGLADARVRFVFMDFSFVGIKPLYCIFSYCLPEAATVRPRLPCRRRDAAFRPAGGRQLLVSVVRRQGATRRCCTLREERCCAHPLILPSEAPPWNPRRNARWLGGAGARQLAAAVKRARGRLAAVPAARAPALKANLFPGGWAPVGALGMAVRC